MIVISLKILSIFLLSLLPYLSSGCIDGVIDSSGIFNYK
jgi:hypothetical protein